LAEITLTVDRWFLAEAKRLIFLLKDE